jgi:hypothetical protein
MRFRRGELDLIEKVNFWLSLLVMLLIILAIAISIYERSWWSLFVSVLALLLSLSDLIHLF